MLEIRLLGPFEIRVGDRVVEVRSRKQRALIAALALRPGELVSSDRLVHDVWGEEAPKTARHALENYVSELRRALGKRAITTRSGGYALAIDRDQVDAARFERLLADARDADAETRAEKLRGALLLVRGEPLADLVFEPFAEGEVGRLAELVLVAREELAEAELELGRHAELVPVLEPLVAAHPYRERLRALLMLALYRAGRQADALAAYQDARRVLVEQLGIDPGEDLQELERSILRQDPVLRAPPRRPVAGRAEPAAAPVASRRAVRKTVTSLVTELANEAALADRLDAEPLRVLLDRYLGAARAAVERHGGTYARHSGSGVMAVFGVPAAHEDDALRAVRAAVDLREAVGALNDGLLPEHGVFLEVRVALNTGEVLVGGDDDLATGKPVSVAERLLGEARPGQILLGEHTCELVKHAVQAEPMTVSPGGTPAFRLVELLADVYGRPIRLDSPLVGRRRQLAALASAFEAAVTDRVVHLFTVLGPAGVGKSRLAGEFVAGLGDLALVLQGRCLPYGEGGAYAPLLEALRAGAPREADAAAPLQPGTAADGRERTFEAIRDLLERLARDRALVLVLDDVQWADPALLDLVEHVPDASREAPILLVCLSRPELLDDRPGWGGGKLNASSLLLESLSEAESERLLDNLLGESDLPDAVRDYAVRLSEGNPLYLEELLATLVHQGVLQRERGRWTTTQIPAIPLPPTIQALIAARIDQLPEGERRLLELASVQGRIFRREVLAQLASEEAPAAFDSSLAALVRKEFVRPRPGKEGGFAFRHQLIRDAAYSSLPMRSRAALHEQLAEWTERSGGGSSGEAVEYHRGRAREYQAALGPAD